MLAKKDAMKRHIFWFVAFGATVLLPSMPLHYVDAQQVQVNMNPPANGPAPDSLGLLSMKAVQEELQLSPQQIKELESLLSQREPAVPHKEVLAKMTEVLGTAKISRLKELTRQAAGAEIFVRDDEVAKAIELTDVQQKKIAAIVERSYRSRQDLVRTTIENTPLRDRNKAFSSPEFKADYMKIMMTSKQETLSALTESQREIYRKLEGKAFDFSTNR